MSYAQRAVPKNGGGRSALAVGKRGNAPALRASGFTGLRGSLRQRTPGYGLTRNDGISLPGRKRRRSTPQGGQPQKSPKGGTRPVPPFGTIVGIQPEGIIGMWASPEHAFRIMQNASGIRLCITCFQSATGCSG